MADLRIALAQINPLVGDIPGNTEQVIDSVRRAERYYGADLVIFPELTLMAYPPEDLLLRASVATRVERGLQALLSAGFQATVMVGYPKVVHGPGGESRIYNAAGVIQGGELIREYHKQVLPNYQVFDDKRYFFAGDQPCVVEVQEIRLAVLICEDIWEAGPIASARELGADLALAMNASPFHVGKQAERLALLQQRVQESGMGVVYLNQVGGQDELVFDGASVAIDQSGTVQFQAPAFETGLYCVDIERSELGLALSSDTRATPPNELEAMYQALVLGVRDYVTKNGFKGVVLGLSGGIDSALTLAIAVDALGREQVEAVMMPFRYTSAMSQSDAAEQARLMGVRYRSISIEPVYDAVLGALRDEFLGLPVDKTEENIQARCRGNLLMAVSNKKGYLVLTTGNKSEMAVGYATLYGDMAGGFDVLKDVSKMRVFALAKYRNSIDRVIPENVILRPPSAELAPDQKDEDSLPPYAIMDEILTLYIERDASAEEIISAGFSRTDVEHVLRLVDINEYKRRQAAIGPRITKRGFGRDRRYPVTSGWKIGD
jgi:NAD+ synthase (glutamine-hydrolysing)